MPAAGAGTAITNKRAPEFDGAAGTMNGPSFHGHTGLPGLTALFLAVATPVAVSAQAGDWQRTPLNFMGVPGMLDMPTAHEMQDADLSLTFAGLTRTGRNSLHFQITPRLSGVFRYVYLDDYGGTGDYYDRSFDLRYLVAEEGAYRPAITVGLQDFGGTGIYSGEYVVGTKTFGRLRATAGIGWGRFGSYNGFTNPLGVFRTSLETRPAQTGGISQTGRLDVKHWFRGDAALFGGLQYQVNDRMIVTAEYSSDAYSIETRRLGFEHRSPVNLGLSYRFGNGLDLSAAYLYGSTFGLRLSYTFNPKSPRRVDGSYEGGPVPVAVRAPGDASDLGWTLQPDASSILRDNVAETLESAGLVLQSLTVGARSAEIRFRNPTFPSSAQAVGRVARILTALLPASVETFEIVPVSANGTPASRITLRRSDLEDLEFAPDGSWQSFARAEITDAAGPVPPGALPGPAAPAFTWGVGPYVETTFFDPDAPIRFDLGVEAHARLEPAPGLVFSGQVKHRLTGNQGDLRPSNSILPHVRSDLNLYASEGQTALSHLTAAKYFRPGENLYGRVTVGYLEQMYAGVSSELLWKPVDSRLAFGLEANYVAQRDFDQAFGLRDYEVFTGHASAYWDGNNGFRYQLDAGRYLAGDWGATLSVDRAFDNGIRIGAFATLTDVSFDDFGEGSFDKGIRFEIPFSALLGRPVKGSVSRTIRPVLRDGGARLNVDGRLYDSVRDYHQPGLQSQWGRFWR